MTLIITLFFPYSSTTDENEIGHRIEKNKAFNRKMEKEQYIYAVVRENA
jgi:hypothetical protein